MQLLLLVQVSSALQGHDGWIVCISYCCFAWIPHSNMMHTMKTYQIQLIHLHHILLQYHHLVNSMDHTDNCTERDVQQTGPRDKLKSNNRCIKNQYTRYNFSCTLTFLLHWGKAITVLFWIQSGITYFSLQR
jgi:hypothetical protein